MIKRMVQLKYIIRTQNKFFCCCIFYRVLLPLQTSKNPLNESVQKGQTSHWLSYSQQMSTQRLLHVISGQRHCSIVCNTILVVTIQTHWRQKIHHHVRRSVSTWSLIECRFVMCRALDSCPTNCVSLFICLDLKQSNHHTILMKHTLSTLKHSTVHQVGVFFTSSGF